MVIRSIQLAAKKFVLNTSWPYTSLSWDQDDLRHGGLFRGTGPRSDPAGYSEQTNSDHGDANKV
jgi:hypothetical protein